MQLPIHFNQLTPGRIFCFHVRSAVDVEPLAGVLSRHADQMGHSAAICLVPWSIGGFFERLRPTRSVAWLARRANISRDVASRLITELGYEIAPILSHNSATPLGLLSIAAGLARPASILIYSTMGMDPLGREFIHEFVDGRAKDRCAVHLSPPTTTGKENRIDRTCPAGAGCVEWEATNVA